MTLPEGAAGTCLRRGPRHPRGWVAGARPALAKHSLRPTPHKAGLGGTREERDVALPKSEVSLPRFPYPCPEQSLREMGAAQGKSRRRGGIFGRWGARVRKDNSRLPPPLGRCFLPTHHPGLPGKGPAWPAGADLGEGGKRGSQPLPGFPPPPFLIGCASLEPNFSRSRLSEPQGSQSAATRVRPRIQGSASVGPPGGGARTGSAPAASSRPSLPRLAASAPLRPPALSFPPSSGLPPPPAPPPPRPPPPPGFSFLPLARSAAHSAAAASRGERREQMPRGPLAAAADL